MWPSIGFTCDFTFLCDFNRAETLAANKRAFLEWIERLFPAVLDVNPLPILMRAVNALRLGHRIIHQPCWRSTRFKSRT